MSHWTAEYANAASEAREQAERYGKQIDLDYLEESYFECEAEFGSECAMFGDAAPGSAIQLEKMLAQINKLRRELGQKPLASNVRKYQTMGADRHDNGVWDW